MSNRTLYQSIIDQLSAAILIELSSLRSEEQGAGHSPDHADHAIKVLKEKVDLLRQIRSGIEQIATQLTHPGF